MLRDGHLISEVKPSELHKGVNNLSEGGSRNVSVCEENKENRGGEGEIQSYEMAEDEAPFGVPTMEKWTCCLIGVLHTCCK